MKIVDGKKIADQILADLKKEIENKKLKPCLAVILVGNNSASRLYLQKKEEAGQKIGIEIKKHTLSSIDSLNKNPKINGILVQLPLPKHIEVDKVISRISPDKDVDGLLPNSKFEPPFILAIYRALLETKEDLKNKKIVALVKSNVFGEKLKSFFNKQGLAIELNTNIQNADIIITALGQPNYIKGDIIKENVILIDGGISKAGNKVVGDIDQESVKDKAKWLSPVPGGLGPLTVAFLLKNLIKAVPQM